MVSSSQNRNILCSLYVLGRLAMYSALWVDMWANSGYAGNRSTQQIIRVYVGPNQVHSTYLLLDHSVKAIAQRL